MVLSLDQNEDSMLVWLKRMDKYFGYDHFKVSAGRPFKKINEDLIIQMKREGCSNRCISRDTGFDRRTIDRRVVKLRKEGKL